MQRKLFSSVNFQDDCSAWQPCNRIVKPKLNEWYSLGVTPNLNGIYYTIKGKQTQMFVEYLKLLIYLYCVMGNVIQIKQQNVCNCPLDTQRCFSDLTPQQLSAGWHHLSVPSKTVRNHCWKMHLFEMMWLCYV